MIQEIIEKWNNHKSDLENYFRTHKQEEYNTYVLIVKKIIEIIINTGEDYEKYNFKKLLVIDDGIYQGTQIFITHKDYYQPSVKDYIYTSNYYGSCPGCDTLQSIQEENEEGYPTENQIKDYLTLSLHLIQKFRRMTDE